MWMSSRIAFHVEFDDYSAQELMDITKYMLSERKRKITDEALLKLGSIYEKACLKSDYGNGRFVRKILEEAEMNLAERVLLCGEENITEELITTIDACDIPDRVPEEKEAERRIGFA